MNRKTETSISEKKNSKKINTDLFQLQKISYHQCECIKTHHESMFATD